MWTPQSYPPPAPSKSTCSVVSPAPSRNRSLTTATTTTLRREEEETQYHPITATDRHGNFRGGDPHYPSLPHPSIIVNLYPTTGLINFRLPPSGSRGLHLTQSRARSRSSIHEEDTGPTGPTSNPVRVLKANDYLDGTMELTEDKKAHYFDDLRAKYHQMNARLQMLQQRHGFLTRQLKPEEVKPAGVGELGPILARHEVIIYFNNTDLACRCFAYSRSPSNRDLRDSTLVSSKTKVTPSAHSSTARADLSALLIEANFLAGIIPTMTTKPYRLSILGNSTITSSGISLSTEEGRPPLIGLLWDIDRVLSGIGTQRTHSMFQELSPEELKIAHISPVMDTVQWLNTTPPSPRKRQWDISGYSEEEFTRIYQRFPDVLRRDRSTWKQGLHQAGDNTHQVPGEDLDHNTIKHGSVEGIHRDEVTLQDNSVQSAENGPSKDSEASSTKIPNSAVKLTPITVPVQRLCVFLPIEEQNHANPEDAQDNHDITAAVDPDESQPLDPSLVGAGGPDDDDPQEKVLSSRPGVLHSPRHARSTGSMTQAEPATADS